MSAIELVDFTDTNGTNGVEPTRDFVHLSVPTGHTVLTPKRSICVAGGVNGDGRRHSDHPIHSVCVGSDKVVVESMIPSGRACPTRWCIECPDACLRSGLCCECNLLFQPCRRLVSTNKQRYETNGYSIDLTYISQRVITHGFPATGIEHVFRNPRYGVRRFLDDHHGDKYHVFNFCAEPGRCYPSSVFYGRVKRFPFFDHQVPKLHVLHQFCEVASEWLDSDPENVCALHCKAGKGRAGVMACCLLLRTGFRESAVDIIKHYDKTRVKMKKKSGRQKGLTVPSQIRYVMYYEALLRESVARRGYTNPGLLGSPPERQLRGLGIGCPIKSGGSDLSAWEGFGREASEESLSQLQARIQSNYPHIADLELSPGHEGVKGSDKYVIAARERKNRLYRGEVGSGNPHKLGSGCCAAEDGTPQTANFDFCVLQQEGFSGKTRDIWYSSTSEKQNGCWVDIREGAFRVKGNFCVRILKNGKKVGQMWLNTSLIDDGARRIVLRKEEIDGLHKDRKHKKYEPDLQVVLEFGSVEAEKKEEK